MYVRRFMIDNWLEIPRRI